MRTMKSHKTFTNYDGLRYEETRLSTYVDWPVTWIKPEDLARDGFYYLRIKDHCACVFCRGIVGTWEEDDTPRGEHQRHFPHCPFIGGRAVGNVPIQYKNILSEKKFQSVTQPENIAGLQPFTVAKRNDFLTFASRLASFNKWSEDVTQKPSELAAAGFFYCGLSDHVRCFHCGNGLRNWETGDQPWKEHARWYPECTFMQLVKGKEFVKEVLQETCPSVTTVASTSTVNNEDLESLMELDVPKEVVKMGFPPEKVKLALRRKIENTGESFFIIQTCIEAVLKELEGRLDKLPTTTKIIPATVNIEEMAALSTSSQTEENKREQTTKCKESSHDELLEMRVCKICMDNESEILFLPCRHFMICGICASAVACCPFCRTPIITYCKPILPPYGFTSTPPSV